jgi:hypothetical protein
MSLSKNRPKCSPTHALPKLLNSYYSGKNISASSVIFKKPPIVNNRPIGEKNSPNPVTLLTGPVFLCLLFMTQKTVPRVDQSAPTLSRFRSMIAQLIITSRDAEESLCSNTFCSNANGI